MKLLIIDDQKEDVQFIIDQISATKLIEVHYKSDYASLGATAADIQKSAQGYDLLVLDIFMGERDPKPFIKFINGLERTKPFIGFTVLRPELDLEVPSGYVEVRKLIFENGGLGLITKDFHEQRGSDHPSQGDIQFSLVEKIMWYFWTTR